MKKFLLIVTILFFNQNVSAEIIVFKDCDSNEYQYKKNKYTLDLVKKEMTREFIYSDESFKKLRLNDMTTKKENISVKRIDKLDGLIVSEVAGYPAFYTQLIFNENEKSIKIKTVLNNTEGVSLISTCKQIIKYKKKV
ncbi:hypothetical protein OAM66_02520 [Pelagibacteraceae bacterium]|jgi:hypothetical protein|nr:hypothetical protein [Pelagibacteraceae bacterium]|tara:strand:+ start:184 stop:597 length:414 start_codon:yes stop_codon:yes gene_type:complete